ncbi:MAG: hypothetical protein HWD59_02585 [Coxiellaceae bacterium]|nr:MAG: hypothetical protein HWD59_02585 [Coxiellaceae bacterium]
MNELSSINAENHSLPFTPDLYLETGLAWLKVGFLRTQNLLATRNTLSLQEIFDELNQKASTFGKNEQWPREHRCDVIWETDLTAGNDEYTICQ